MERTLLGAALATLILSPGAGLGLEIETRYFGPGQSIPSIGVAGARPENAVGGGDLPTVFRAAADAWESLIADDFKLTLNYGWYPTGEKSNSAFHVTSASGGIPTREVIGSIALNNGVNGFEMFIDPTPRTSEEFTLNKRLFSDYGAGPIEDVRRFRATAAEAQGRNDLYTAALHEIGHALGLTRIAPFTSETGDGFIDLTSGAFAGSRIPVTDTHLDTPGALLSSTPRPIGERRGVTQLDLEAVCQVSGFTGCAIGLPRADFAGDLNADGVTDAADYTVWRDSLVDADPTPGAATSGAIYSVWSSSFGRTFTTQASLEGDYNADGRVDAADYTLWRDSGSRLDLRADGDADGNLTAADRDLWASLYGSGGRASAPRTAVPEPGAIGQAVFLVLLVQSYAKPSDRHSYRR